MSEKIIPAKTILICDRCDAETEGQFNSGLRLDVNKYSRDVYGNMGGSRYKFDLCSVCKEGFERFMDNKVGE